MNNGFNGQTGYNQQPMQGGYIPPAPVQQTHNKISGAAIASIIAAALMCVCMFLPYLSGKASAYGVTVSESVSLFYVVFGLGEIAKALGGDFSTIANVFGFLFGTVALDTLLVILLEALGANAKGARVGALVATILANLIIAFYTLVTFAAAGSTSGVDVGIGCIGMWLLSIALIVTTAMSIPDKNRASGAMPIQPIQPIQPMQPVQPMYNNNPPYGGQPQQPYNNPVQNQQYGQPPVQLNKPSDPNYPGQQ